MAGKNQGEELRGGPGLAALVPSRGFLGNFFVWSAGYSGAKQCSDNLVLGRCQSPLTQKEAARLVLVIQARRKLLGVPMAPFGVTLFVATGPPSAQEPPTSST